MTDWRRPLALTATSLVAVFGCRVVFGFHVEVLLVAVAAGMAVAMAATAAVLAVRHVQLVRRMNVAGSPVEINGFGIIDVPGVSPLVAGLVRPRVYGDRMVVAELDAAHRRAVLLHEQSHQRQFDPARLVVLDAIDRCLGFIPAVRSFGNRARAQIEIRADRHALANGATRTDLARALLRLADSPQVLATFGAVTDQRLRALLNGDHTVASRSRWMWGVAATVIAAGAATCLSVSGAAHADIMWAIQCASLHCTM